MPDFYPYRDNLPGYYDHAPETSREAAESVADAAKSREVLALKFLEDRGPDGGSSDEVAEAYDWDKYSARPRLSTLKAMGKIADSGRRRKAESGRWQVVGVLSCFAPVPDSIVQEASE
ncbi:MAG: hypothetical protein EOP21_10615 [Hyphomicrobiales bacterium]|nr:MAG: hypothetical protein EOP21_10615 [Hyphomicrobiales bacterium]